MKIGINFVGISSGKMYDYNSRSRDWKITRSHIKDNVIDCWNPPHETIVYLTTYSNYSPHISWACNQEEIRELIEFYAPQRYQIIQFNVKHTTQKLTHMNSLRMWLDSDVDMVVSTRFDIEFFDKISNYDIDFDKVNFLFAEGPPWGDPAWEAKRYVTDNIFFIPKKYLQAFIDSIECLLIGEEEQFFHLHGVHRPLELKIGSENIKLISSKPQFSCNGGNEFFYLHRDNGSHEISREDITRVI